MSAQEFASALKSIGVSAKEATVGMSNAIRRIIDAIDEVERDEATEAQPAGLEHP